MENVLFKFLKPSILITYFNFNNAKLFLSRLVRRRVLNGCTILLCPNITFHKLIYICFQDACHIIFGDSLGANDHDNFIRCIYMFFLQIFKSIAFLCHCVQDFAYWLVCDEIIQLNGVSGTDFRIVTFHLTWRK